MIYEEVEALVGVLRSSPTLTELEVRKGDRVVRLRRAATGKTPSKSGAAVVAPAVSAASLAAPLESVAMPSSPAASGAIPTPSRVTAGLVGVFHPSRTAPVTENQIVRKGQVLGQIEAMRLMNDVAATTDGRVLSVLVEDGQPVEYGQPLFEIVPA